MKKDLPKIPVSASIEPPPDADELTGFDRSNMALYLKLLDAETAGVDWATAAKDILQLDPVADPDNVKQVFDQFLRRARWMTNVGYQQLMQSKQ
jgi:hypothetical protein